MPFNPRHLALVCVALGLTQLVPALWIVVAPHSFFTQVGPFGSYNGHYLGDAASFQAGIGVALIAAARFEALRAGALAVVVATVGFHAINHWIDVNNAHAGSDAGITDAVLLTLLTLLALAPLRAAVERTNP
jgi:hypothetical protein